MITMLAFELYRKNKDSTTGDVKKLIPIKKIFYNRGAWSIDSKTIQEYGSDVSDKFSEVQNWLSMPLSTTNPDELNLPDYRTSPRQADPYIIIKGMLKTDKSGKLSLTLYIGNKSGKKEHVINISQRKKKSNDNKVKVSPRLEKKCYKINGESIFDLYVKCRIINSKGVLNNSEYEKIIDKFRQYIPRSLQNLPKKGRNFEIYLLPSRATISFDDDNNQTSPTQTNSFIDSFGNVSNKYASKATKHAKFLSSNDKAFTLNCKQKEEFYENLGIGDKSVHKIFFPQNLTFTISGFRWLFTDISSSGTKFIDTRKGIYSQLYENYDIIASANPTRREKALLKVICYKEENAKQEILIDENMTMDKMQRLFQKVKKKDIPVGAFEVLIETDNESVLWNNYLYAIKHFLAESKIPKSYLLKIFTKILRSKIHHRLKFKKFKEQSEFFRQTEFCIKSLCMSMTDNDIMKTNEKFACRVGLISRHYVDFKEKIGEKSNSLKDILTYSKYDREKLRFVLQRIGIGINLAKASDNEISEITKTVDKLHPKDEISDEEAHKDYSYFFYKGYYTKECEL